MKITRTINGQEITIELTAEEMQKVNEEYLREDIQRWANDNDKYIDRKLENKMVCFLAKEDDANFSRWDNIENAYFFCED